MRPLLLILLALTTAQIPIRTYIITPQMHSKTSVGGEVSLSRDLTSYTVCLRVKPILLQRPEDKLDKAMCHPIALSFQGRHDGQLFHLTTGRADDNDDDVIKLWMEGCRSVIKHKTSQLLCDGIWRTVCVSVKQNSIVELAAHRDDDTQRSETATLFCKETAVMQSGGKFSFNQIQIQQTNEVFVSDSVIKDVMIWDVAFSQNRDYKTLAQGNSTVIPKRDNLAWVFNYKSAHTQSGPVTVEEYPFGKGMTASPAAQLLSKDDRAVLTCQVVLNDYQNISSAEYGVRWFHQSTDAAQEAESPHGHAHEVKRTFDSDRSIYSLQQSEDEQLTNGWFYCLRSRIKGVEKEYRSNLVHISVVESVCKAFRRKDDKYGFLEFSSALPGDFSIAKCHGGEAKLLCTKNSTWDVLKNRDFSCNTLIHNTLIDIINGTAPRISELEKITSESFTKMTQDDFFLVPDAVLKISGSVYNKAGIREVLEILGEFTEIPTLFLALSAKGTRL